MFRESEDYEHFADFIRTKSRYVLDGWQQNFVSTIVETSKKRTTTLPANQILWRAAPGYENPDGVHPHDVFFLDDIKPHKIERMKPLRDRAHEGRVNPRGIPCLYMATDDVTAMMEVRPWAGSVLTISQLVLLKEVALVDCTQAAEFGLDEPMTQQRLEGNNWHVLNEAFSLPVFQAEDVADYAPTQYIAEAFRAAKYDGIMYESKVGNGKNVAIFDPAIAGVVSRQLRQANKPSFSFSKVGAATFEEKYKEIFPTPESAASDEEKAVKQLAILS
jgi:RES domain-containing protein